MPPEGLPSASQALTRRNLSPESSSSLRVETTVPMTLPRTIFILADADAHGRAPAPNADARRRTRALLALAFVLAAERQRQIDVGVRARDHVHADQLADPLGGALAGLGRGLDGGDVAAHDGGDVPAADLLVPDELHARGLHHRVRGLDHPDEALGLDHSQRVSHCSVSLLKRNCYLSTNFSGSLPVTPSIAAIAACEAESISDSVPDMYRRPNAP